MRANQSYILPSADKKTPNQNRENGKKKPVDNYSQFTIRILRKKANKTNKNQSPSWRRTWKLQEYSKYQYQSTGYLILNNSSTVENSQNSETLWNTFWGGLQSFTSVKAFSTGIIRLICALNKFPNSYNNRNSTGINLPKQTSQRRHSLFWTKQSWWWLT